MTICSEKNEYSIGSYFELETNLISEYHPNSIAVNTARNALEYILLAKKIQKIHLPYYTCDVLLEPLKRLQLPYEFYAIDAQLEPIFDYSKLKEDEYLLYTNYYGLKQDFIRSLVLTCKNIIIDNAQAFYAQPFAGVPTFYSARKFFGVPDGAYLYCDEMLEQFFDTDCSFERMTHLLMRKDQLVDEGYAYYSNNEALLSHQPIRFMSKLTQSILKSIDYDTIARIRIENFNTLHAALGQKNKFDLSFLNDDVPLVYPFWSEDLSLRTRLLEHKIYTATYWPNVKDWCSTESLEYSMNQGVVALPIDQRYGLEEMKVILKVLGL